MTKNLKHYTERFYLWSTDYKFEEKCLKKFIENYTSENPKILDVGCGKGRILQYLQSQGYSPKGVDLNPVLVGCCRQQGLEAYTTNELNEQLQFDVIIMFHVIEHMGHEKLLEFMDSYLDLLLPGGLLIIATPVMTPYFYEDFDHVKPYLPSGILMVFGGEASQVQYYSKNKLRLLDLKYKKYFWRFPNYRSVYFPSLFDRAARIISALIYKFSFGWIGRVDGWLGVFQKQ